MWPFAAPNFYFEGATLCGEAARSDFLQRPPDNLFFWSMHFFASFQRISLYAPSCPSPLPPVCFIKTGSGPVISGPFAQVNFFQPNSKLIKSQRGWRRRPGRLKRLGLTLFCLRGFTCGHERRGRGEGRKGDPEVHPRVHTVNLIITVAFLLRGPHS